MSPADATRGRHDWQLTKLRAAVANARRKPRPWEQAAQEAHDHEIALLEYVLAAYRRQERWKALRP